MTSIKTLNGTAVTEECYEETKSAITRGKRAILMPAEPGLDSDLLGDDGCPNCSGGGTIIVGIIESGPLKKPNGGTGYIWLSDGWYKTENTSYPCPVCASDRMREKVARLLAGSGVHPTEREWTLGYLARHAQGKQELVQLVQGIINQAPRPSGFYSLFGHYGMGKSGAMKVLVCSLVRCGVPACYVRAEDILSQARAAFADDPAARQTSEHAVKQRYLSYRLLAIDELDRVSLSDWAKAFLFSLLDERYNQRQAVATIMATNLMPDELIGDWGYLASRLSDGRRIIVGGVSLRGGG